MKVTVTNYNNLTELEFSEYITDKQIAALKRKGFRWSREKCAWTSYERGEDTARDIFDAAEFEVVNKKSPIELLQNNGKTELNFYEIPDEDTREELKENGFKWNPVQKIWYSTADNAEEITRRIFPEDKFEFIVKNKDSATNEALYNVIDALNEFIAASKKATSALVELEEKNEIYAERIRKDLDCGRAISPEYIQYAEENVAEIIGFIRRHMIK